MNNFVGLEMELMGIGFSLQTFRQRMALHKTKWQKTVIATNENVEDLFDYDMNIAIKNKKNSTEIEEWETKKKSFKEEYTS